MSYSVLFHHPTTAGLVEWKLISLLDKTEGCRGWTWVDLKDTRTIYFVDMDKEDAAIIALLGFEVRYFSDQDSAVAFYSGNSKTRNGFII